METCFYPTTKLQYAFNFRSYDWLFSILLSLNNVKSVLIKKKIKDSLKTFFFSVFVMRNSSGNQAFHPLNIVINVNSFVADEVRTTNIQLNQ